MIHAAWSDPATEHIWLLAKSAVAESQERHALHHPTGKRHAKLKSGSQRAADRARVQALCEALYYLGCGLSPLAVKVRLLDEYKETQNPIPARNIW